MNYFTVHDCGPYADDGFGNLVILTLDQRRQAIFYSITFADEMEFYA